MDICYGFLQLSALVRAGAKGAWAPVKIEQWVKAPNLRRAFRFKNCQFIKNHKIM